MSAHSRSVKGAGVERVSSVELTETLNAARGFLIAAGWSPAEATAAVVAAARRGQDPLRWAELEERKPHARHP